MNPPRVPCDEAALVKAYLGGLTMRQAGAETGVSIYVARRVLREAGIERRGIRMLQSDEIDQGVAAYVNDVVSVDNAAKIARVTGVKMRAILVDRGVTIRPRGVARRIFLTPDQLVDAVKLYEDGTAIARIGQLIDNIGANAIQRAFVEAGVSARQRGAAHRGPGEFGRFADPRAYVHVGLLPEHPYYSMANGNDYVLEHRLVMATALGRPLHRKETVHHVDGQHHHNALSNLQLRSGHHGQGIVLQCAACGSHDVGPVPLPPEVTRG